MILSISCETIVGSDGYYVNGNFLEKYLFLAASKFGLLNTIDVLALKSKIKKQILGVESDLIIPQKGIFLDYSRPRLLDRLLRFLWVWT